MLWSKKYLIARLRFNLTYGSYSFLYIFYVDNNGNSDFTATYNGPYVSLTLFSSRSHSLLQSLGKCTNWGKLKLALSLFQCAWQTIKKPIRSNAFIMSEYMKMHFIYCMGHNWLHMKRCRIGVFTLVQTAVICITLIMIHRVYAIWFGRTCKYA